MLKGRDRARAEVARDACAEVEGFRIYIGQVSANKTYPDDDTALGEEGYLEKGASEPKEQVLSERLRTPEDIEVGCRPCHAGLDFMLDWSTRRIADEEWGGEHLGNEHAEISK